MVEFNKHKVGEEIVRSFHEQFAQNQNHHQSLFLQVLTVLLTVLIGFGYLYIRVGAKSEDVHVTSGTIYIFLALASWLLSLSIALISNMALGFRRDQLVACNIRVKTGTMSKLGEKDTGYFIQGFNPVGKTAYLFWMPEFHMIFFVSLIVIKLLLFLSLILNSDLSIGFSCSPNILITYAIVAICLSFITDLLVSVRYWKKWENHSENAPERLQKENGRSE